MYYSTNAAQRDFIRKGIKADIRLDGRKTTELKKPKIAKGILNQAQGSALLTSPFQHTTIYSSIKLQLIRRTPSTPTPPISLSIESVRRRIDQSTPRQDSADLSILQQLLTQLLIAHLPYTPFFIPQSHQYMLKVSLDVFLMNYVHMSNLDMVYQSVKASLEDLRIQRFRVLRNEVTSQEDLEVTEDDLGYEGVGEIPDVFLVGEVNGQLLCDMTVGEYEAVENVFVVAMRGEKVLGIKQLQGEIQPEALLKIIKFAAKVHQTHKLFENQA